MNNPQTETQTETFTTMQIGEHTVILSSLTQAHIDMHNRVGTGSAFMNPFTLDMLPEEIVPGPNKVVSESPIGYSLVDKVKYATFLPDATSTTAVKQGVINGVLQDIKVPAVRTSMPLEYFETNVCTILLFPYNPEYATKEMKQYVANNNLETALVLATAFPGEFAIRGIDVPAASGLNGTQWNVDGWAVIIPA